MESFNFPGASYQAPNAELHVSIAIVRLLENWRLSMVFSNLTAYFEINVNRVYTWLRNSMAEKMIHVIVRYENRPNFCRDIGLSDANSSTCRFADSKDSSSTPLPRLFNSQSALLSCLHLRMCRVSWRVRPSGRYLLWETLISDSVIIVIIVILVIVVIVVLEVE